VDVRLRLGSRAVSVTLAPEKDGFAASLDGNTHSVTRLGGRACGPGAEEIVLEIDGRPCRALIARVHGRVLVSLAGRVFAFETGEDSAGAHAGVGSGVVTAPMPGKVVAVLVAVGETVEVGQPLVVLEAMKMESTLSAEVAGRVTAVAAVAGATVAAGDLLVEVRPATDEEAAPSRRPDSA